MLIVIDMDNVKDIQSITESNPPSEFQIKSFSTTLERDKYILECYSKAVRLIDIAKEVGLSEVRISQIVRNNKASVTVDREFEKVRRFRRLKMAEEKSSKAIKAEDASDLVKLIECQRKELEGDHDSHSTTNNVQINIKADSSQIDLWSTTRSLLNT